MGFELPLSHRMELRQTLSMRQRLEQRLTLVLLR